MTLGEGTTLGAYRIVRKIGEGGMGAVYRAEHVHMRKAVAVKVLHKEMTAFPEVVARFEREAVAAGRIEHPHVVSASDFGKLEDGSFRVRTRVRFSGPYGATAAGAASAQVALLVRPLVSASRSAS